MKVFLNPDGDDRNIGTLESPVRTITAALNRFPKSVFGKPLNPYKYGIPKYKDLDVYQLVLDERVTPSIRTPSNYIREYILTKEDSKRFNSFNQLLRINGGRTNEFGDLPITILEENFIGNYELRVPEDKRFNGQVLLLKSGEYRPIFDKRNWVGNGFRKEGVYYFSKFSENNEPKLGDIFRICKESVLITAGEDF